MGHLAKEHQCGLVRRQEAELLYFHGAWILAALSQDVTVRLLYDAE